VTFWRAMQARAVRELMETEHAHDDKLWQAIADQGWMGWSFPKSMAVSSGTGRVGGGGGRNGARCLPGAFSRRFSRPLSLSGGQSGAAGKVPRAVAAGELKATVAFLEETANWDLDGVNWSEPS